MKHLKLQFQLLNSTNRVNFLSAQFIGFCLLCQLFLQLVPNDVRVPPTGPKTVGCRRLPSDSTSR